MSRRQNALFMFSVVSDLVYSTEPSFLSTRIEGEGFNAFIVLKDTNSGPVPVWVKVGTTDLNNIEVISGLEKNDIVYVLPSDGLIKYQQRFSERLKSRF